MRASVKPTGSIAKKLAIGSASAGARARARAGALAADAAEIGVRVGERERGRDVVIGEHVVVVDEQHERRAALADRAGARECDATLRLGDQPAGHAGRVEDRELAPRHRRIRGVVDDDHGHLGTRRLASESGEDEREHIPARRERADAEVDAH